MKVADVKNDNIRLDGMPARLGPVLAIVGLAALGLSAALGTGEGWNTFWKSYLVGFMVALGLCLGALFFILLQHMTRSGWSVSVGRLAEGIAKNLSWLWMCFVPILTLVLKGDGEVLYEWGNRELMESDHMLHAKAGYLSPVVWSIRAIMYLAVWTVIGTL